MNGNQPNRWIERNRYANTAISIHWNYIHSIWHHNSRTHSDPTSTCTRFAFTAILIQCKLKLNIVQFSFNQHSCIAFACDYAHRDAIFLFIRAKWNDMNWIEQQECCFCLWHFSWFIMHMKLWMMMTCTGGVHRQIGSHNRKLQTDASPQRSVRIRRKKEKQETKQSLFVRITFWDWWQSTVIVTAHEFSRSPSVPKTSYYNYGLKTTRQS